MPVEFARAGTLTAGDHPELFLFRVRGEEIAVGVSGTALQEWQSARRLSREEKIDLAGLHLKRQIEAGRPLDSQHLYLRVQELQELSQALGLRATRQG